jgi:hypothetical protein
VNYTVPGMEEKQAVSAIDIFQDRLNALNAAPGPVPAVSCHRPYIPTSPATPTGSQRPTISREHSATYRRRSTWSSERALPENR